MIFAVTLQFHDYEPDSFLIDTDKLSENDLLHKKIMKEMKKKNNYISVSYDGSKDDNKGIESDYRLELCRHEVFPANVSKLLYLQVYFE